MSHHAVVFVSRLTQELRHAPLVLQTGEIRAGVAISMPPHPPFLIILYDVDWRLGGGGGSTLLTTLACSSRADG